MLQTKEGRKETGVTLKWQWPSIVSNTPLKNLTALCYDSKSGNPLDFMSGPQISIAYDGKRHGICREGSTNW